MTFSKHFLSIFILTLLLIGCGSNSSRKELNKSLKDTFKDKFYIGAALNANQILGTDSVQKNLIKTEFNSITAENIMKSMHIHPARDSFNFDLPDKFVELGEKNNMFILGHTLIWHSQLSPFIRTITDSTEMVDLMNDHISTIVGRYKGRIDAWDVVNEALNDDGTLRKTVFLEVLGERYLALAFKLAAEADPDADLYYNDYSMTNPNKRKGAIALVKKLQEQGVKVDGIGMQGHWDLNYPSLEEIETSIIEYASLGVKVAITELDVSVIPMPWDFSGADVNVKFESSDPTMNPYPESLPDSIQDKLAQRYEDIFKLFLKHEDKISRVTFWGVCDGDSWKNDWPIPGRTNYPLLFDRDNKPKKCYHNVIGLIE